MKVETIPVGPFEVNCYVAWGDGREAIVVDPGDDADRILRVLDANHLSVAVYLLTHGHCDHVSALASARNRYPAPVALHPADAAWAFTPENQLPPFYGQPEAPESIDRLIEDGQEFTDAGFAYRVIATPGHTPGGVSFHFPAEKILFAGDTLFQGSVGRTDIPGGNPRTLAESLKTLAALPPDTRVYPGHGLPTTIDIENRTNFFLRRRR